MTAVKLTKREEEEAKREREERAAADWKALNAKLKAAGLDKSKIELSPKRTTPGGASAAPKETERWRVVRSGRVLGLGRSPDEAVSRAIFLFGARDE